MFNFVYSRFKIVASACQVALDGVDALKTRVVCAVVTAGDPRPVDGAVKARGLFRQRPAVLARLVISARGGAVELTQRKGAVAMRAGLLVARR